MIQVELHDGIVRVRWQDRLVLRFSATLPARQVLRDPGYSLKGWWWCAFQEILERERVERADPMQDFEEIWEQIKPA